MQEARVTILLAVLSLFSACTKSDKEIVRQNNPKSDSIPVNVNRELYICRYHPMEKHIGPGMCPVCGASLISKDSYDKDMARRNEEMKKKWKSYIGAVYTVIDLPVLKCYECERVIVSSLMEDKGILDFQVDIINNYVALFYEPGKTKLESMELLIRDAGFDANRKKANPDAVRNLPGCCK